MSGDSKEFKFDPETSILGGLRERLDKLEQHVRPDLSLINEILTRLNKLEEKPTIEQIRRTYVFNKLQERINSLENDFMRHQDKDRDYAYLITDQANAWIKGFKNRLEKLETEKPTLDQIELTHVLSKLQERIIKLESSTGSKTQKAVIAYYNDDYGGDYDCIETRSRLDKFLSWLDENGFEIRGKK